MKLKRIVLKGFIRFKDSFEVEFPQNQVTLIAGENGAGKTSILDALCVCLYGRTFRTSGRASSGFLSINDLVNHESNKATIRVEFENHGHNYVVNRQITRNDSDGELLEDGESKAIGRHVYTYVKNRAIGLDWEGFRKSTVVLQGEMSALTDLDPGPRKKAFTELFGLDRYFAYEQLAKEKGKDKESDIHATEEANKILQADIQKIPAVKDEIKQAAKEVKALAKKKDRLDKAVESRKINVKTLESSHTEYIKQREKVETIKGQIDDTKKSVNKNRAEVNRLLSIQRQFDALENSYTTYSSLEEKASKLNPIKSKHDNFSNKIDRYTIALSEKRYNLSDTVRQMSEVRSVIVKLQKQIPSSSELAKTEKDLKKASDEEKSLRGRSNSLRGQIKQIDESIEELQTKRDQVKGKDKCPVCLQKITDPQHVMKHYNDGIGALVSKRSVLEQGRTSILQELKTLLMLMKDTQARPTELLGLKVSDINLSYDPPYLNIVAERAKNDLPREIFFTPETKDLLISYIKKKDKQADEFLYLHSIDPLDEVAVQEEIETVSGTMRTTLRNLLAGQEFADMNEKVKQYGTMKRYKLHIYSFKKFAFTVMADSLGEIAARAIKGDREYVLTYYRKNREERAADYKKVIPKLSVFSKDVAPTAIDEIEAKIRAMDGDELAKLQEFLKTAKA